MSIHPPIPAYIPLPIYASNHPFISPSIHPSPSNLSFYHLLIHFSFHPFICHLFIFLLFVQSFNQPSFILHPPFHPSVCPFKHTPICPSKVHHLFILPVSTHYLSIHLSIHPCLHLSNFRSSCPFNLPFIHTSFHPLFHLFIYPPTHLFINLFSLHTSNHHPPSTVYPFIHPSADSSILPSSNYLSINPCISLSICIKYPQIHPTIYTCSFTHSFTHSPSFYPFFISHTLSFTTHPMILTYKHPSSFHTQIYPPIHLSIPPHPVHGYFCNIYLPVHS